jgi:hypothetical protein
MKKAAILGLTTIIIIVLTIVTEKVDSAPKQLTDRDWERSKANWNMMLAKTSTPPSVGHKLVDAVGGKSDCHLMSYTVNQKNDNATSWTCWGEKGTTFPKVATRWSKITPDLSITADPAHPLPSVGNTMTDNDNHQHNCHLTNHLVNNKGITVSQWTCWSKGKLQFKEKRYFIK